jgi:hypothetical protein
MVKFDVEIKNIEPVNPLFSRCLVYICYSDLNRNQSVISKDLLNSKLYSLIGCPIVGQFNKSKGDFTDHGGAVEEDINGDFKYVVTTIPYGFIPDNSEIKWEFVEGKDYLTATGYLWTSRYPDSLKVIEEGRPQSMEIDMVKGEFNRKKEFVITDFVFSALTILGEDVDPCFEDAKIVGYSKNEYGSEFTKIFDELKMSFTSSTQIESCEDISNEEEDEAVSKTKADIAAQFSLTVNQLSEEMSRSLSNIKYETTNWYDETVEVSRFYLRDFDDQYAYVVDRQADYIDVKIPYIMSGDDVTFDVSGLKRVKYVPTDWEESTVEFEGNFSLQLFNEVKVEISKLIEAKQELSNELSQKADVIISINEQFSNLQTQFTEKETEIESLNTYKKEIEDKERKDKVDSLFATYAKQLSKDEIEELRSKESTFATVELFEKEIKAFVCDKLIADFKPQSPTFSRMAIPNQTDKTPTESSNVWERLESKDKE